MRDDYSAIATERGNPRTASIDRMSTEDMMRTINDESRAVYDAVDGQITEIAATVDKVAEAMANGGCLIYVGAGTSGRLGVVDASECPPTFGVEPHLVRGIIAGGKEAMFRSIEGAEDSEELGREAIELDGVTERDVVVGISASGRAPFVLGALQRASEIGAYTVGLTCNPSPLLAPLCKITITANAGPEVISGSTRLKAGTVQKLVLNMISTGAMIKTGRVRGNYMVNVKPTNEKLTERATRIIMELGGCDRDTAASLLERHGSVTGALDELERDA